MKRRTEHLVEKRRSARVLASHEVGSSIHLALFEIGVDEDWRALELATVVLEGLRTRRTGDPEASVPGGSLVLSSGEIADAVQHLLVVTGQPAAAVSYGAVQASAVADVRPSTMELPSPTAAPRSTPTAMIASAVDGRGGLAHAACARRPRLQVVRG